MQKITYQTHINPVYVHQRSFFFLAVKKKFRYTFNSPLQVDTMGLFETNKSLSLHAESDLQASDPR